MATRKDVLLVQIVSALAEGSAGAEMEDDAANWFHDRYYEWIDKPKTSAETGGRRPQDVWGSVGRDFLQRFREIGQLAASDGSPITLQAMEKSAMTIERQNECPWCADKP
jgi:hypothetical protein